jgi:hypothetical protein
LNYIQKKSCTANNHTDKHRTSENTEVFLWLESLKKTATTPITIKQQTTILDGMVETPAVTTAMEMIEQHPEHIRYRSRPGGKDNGQFRRMRRSHGINSIKEGNSAKLSETCGQGCLIEKAVKETGEFAAVDRIVWRCAELPRSLTEGRCVNTDGYGWLRSQICSITPAAYK